MKMIYTVFPWLPGAPVPPAPSHVEVAQSQLNEARIRLLEEEKVKERAMANCETLRARIRRLEAYIRDSAGKQQ